jgi:acyl carrier protein
MRADDCEAAEILHWCVGFVAEMLERSPNEVDPNVKFGRLGLDSAMAVQLIVALEARLGLQLTPDVIGDCPTISRLSAHLVQLCVERPQGL